MQNKTSKAPQLLHLYSKPTPTPSPSPSQFPQSYQQLSTLPNLPNRQTQQLIKIEPYHTFPCFTCYDDATTRGKCKTCEGRGFVMGNHPMVMFVQEFLCKNLGEVVAREEGKMGGSGGGSANQEQEQVRGFLGRDNTRKECRSALESYTAHEPQNQVSQNLVKSSKPSDNCSVHVVFGCNICNVEPIKGNRFHCLECEDFDLCEKCHKQIMDTKGTFERHRWLHKFEKISLTKPQEVIEKLSGIRLSNTLSRKK